MHMIIKKVKLKKCNFVILLFFNLYHACLLFSPKAKCGSHWFVVFHFDDTYEVFDSLGADQTFILSNIPFYGKYLEFNRTSVQSLNSKDCGLFCLYFIINRLENLDFHFDEILNIIFSKNLILNERKVLDFLK